MIFPCRCGHAAEWHPWERSTSAVRVVPSPIFVSAIRPTSVGRARCLSPGCACTAYIAVVLAPTIFNGAP